MLVGSRPARSSTRRFCSACRTNTFARRRWRSASWTTTAWAATSASGRSCWAQRAARWMEVRRFKQLVPTFTPVSAPTRDFTVSGGPTGADRHCSPSSNQRRYSPDWSRDQTFRLCLDARIPVPTWLYRPTSWSRSGHYFVLVQRR